MNEEKKPVRSTAEIQQEYQNLAFRAGNLFYELSQRTNDLDLLKVAMRDLNFEFIAAKEAEAKAAPAAAPEAPAITPEVAS